MVNTDITIRSYEAWDFGLFKACYINYMNELALIMQEPISVDPDDYIDWLVHFEEANIYMLYKDSVQCGFLITGFGTNCCDGCDLFIMEFYIVPEFRKQGLGTAAMKNFISEHPGRYCLKVHKNNEIAQSFWSNLQNGIGSTDISDKITDPRPNKQFELKAFKI